MYVGLEAAYREKQQACERATEELSKSKHLLPWIVVVNVGVCVWSCVCVHDLVPKSGPISK